MERPPTLPAAHDKRRRCMHTCPITRKQSGVRLPILFQPLGQGLFLSEGEMAKQGAHRTKGLTLATFLLALAIELPFPNACDLQRRVPHVYKTG